jgi:hypothetical protein
MDDPIPSDQPPAQPEPAPPVLARPQSQFPAIVQPGNGLAVAGLVLGITCVIFSWWGIFTLVQVVLAITFSAIGRGHAKRGAPHGGLATAGLVLGIIGAVIYFLIGIFSFGAGFFI